MSTKFIDLDDRIVTDEGQVIAKFALLFDRCRSGQSYTDLLSERDWQVELFNRRSGDELPDIEIWDDDGEVNGPPEESYEWTIPQEYQELNIYDMCFHAFNAKVAKGNIDDDEVYANRLMDELQEMDKRDMFPFVRCLVYVRDRFRKNNVVWGVGRGSSCASLVFYLLDINRVDPVKYEIPKEEFFKPEKMIDETT